MSQYDIRKESVLDRLFIFIVVFLKFIYKRIDSTAGLSIHRQCVRLKTDQTDGRIYNESQGRLIENDHSGGGQMRYFNTEGSCSPEEHYMVRLDDRLARIKRQLVDRNKYFVISRGRQYGKTTTLQALAKYLGDTYLVILLDFQRIGTDGFVDSPTFVHAFVGLLIEAVEMDMLGDETMLEPLRELIGKDNAGLNDMFVQLSRMCKNSSRPVVLMIDEVDSASNNQIFIDFLAQLRSYYLARKKMPTFQSVILAGVYDIKNLKLKIRPDSEHQYNSPWNIAADFNIDMNFSTDQITVMLDDYERDHQTGMEVRVVAEEIYAYTSGYPVLVSAICKNIDEELAEESRFEKPRTAWSAQGVAEAVKQILRKSTPLFESMVKQLDLYKDLESMIEGILYQGRRIPFEIDVKPINIGKMMGFLQEENGQVAVANRMFEMKLLNTFIAREALESESYRSAQNDANQFIRNGRLNMSLLLKKFVDHFHEVYDDRDERFIEDNGRRFFLLYLKPIINGTGNYYIEAQTRDARRTDVIVDYRGEQFIVELKIWRGKEYHERGERQLTDYLDYYHKDKGYMVSFNFNQKKETGVKELHIGDKIIVEAVV